MGSSKTQVMQARLRVEVGAKQLNNGKNLGVAPDLLAKWKPCYSIRGYRCDRDTDA